MAVTHGRLRILADPPWGWAAGMRHPPEAEYPAGFFTAAQLDQLRADPALRLEEMDEVRASQPSGNDPAAGAAAGGEGNTLAANEMPEAEGAALNSPQANGADAPAQEADAPAAASGHEMPQGEGSGAPAEAAAPVATAATVPSGGEARAEPAEGAAVAPAASPAPASPAPRRRRNS